MAEFVNSSDQASADRREAPARIITPMNEAMRGDSPLSRRELRDFMQRSNRPGLVRLGIWLLILATTGTLVHLSADSTAFLLAAMFVHGLVLVHHFAILHECTHFTAFRSRGLCIWLTRVFGFLLFVPPLHFRYEHCDHHTYTNQQGRDPQLIELPLTRAHYLLYLSALPYWYYNVSGLFRRAFGCLNAAEKRFIPLSERPAVVREARLMLAGYALIILAMIAFDWLAPFTYWLLPMLLAEPVMRFTRMSEHVGRPMVADRRSNTRTTVVSLPRRFLAWNMNYHAEHHYAASVPFFRLGQLHERLRGHVYVEPHGYLSAHRDILQRMVSRQQQRSSDVA